MAELSVIIPFVNEYPQVLFTVQSIAQELRDRVDFEIIAVNNFCPEFSQRASAEDAGGRLLRESAGNNPWLKVIDYKHKLSHWQAKNAGVQEARSDVFWFPDAHVVPGRDVLVRAFDYYKKNWEELNGTLHLPLTYQILEWRQLIYRLVVDESIGKYHYTFNEFAPLPSDNQNPRIFEVPVMSTCGCLMHRSVYNKLGGWPTELGIYGGGEQFVNFAGATMGLRRWVYACGLPLYHHGAERSYRISRTGWTRNDLIASYMYGGLELVQKKLPAVNLQEVTKQRLYQDLADNIALHRHRKYIEEQQIISIQEWATRWSP